LPLSGPRVVSRSPRSRVGSRSTPPSGGLGGQARSDASAIERDTPIEVSAAATTSRVCSGSAPVTARLLVAVTTVATAAAPSFAARD
jgi:hypothetical protein